MKTLLSTRWFHPLLLLVWIVIGTGLRFTQLTGKSPWTDEFATLVFSLGHSYQTVPIDQAISLDTLLQPLQFNREIGISAVMHHLFTEDHHPPLYFVLAHWWMQLFSGSGEYVSLWIARSLPALLGVASIPAVYGLGWLAFRSRLVAALAAAMMAVSPYSIFLAQEARHYTLAILWVIASLSCLVIAVQHLNRRTPLPIWLGLVWVVVNSLGMASHYFFSLTLCAEAIALIGFWLLSGRFISLGWRIWAVALGTLVGCLVWIPVWQVSRDAQMTQWIMSSDRTGWSLLSPIFQALATWITMLSLLPVEASSLVVVIASGAVMLGFFIWAVPILYRSCKVLLEKPDYHLAVIILAGFVVGAIAIFFGITYCLGTDLTRGARYNFVYFPAVIVLVGAALAICWHTTGTSRSNPSLGLASPPRLSAKSLRLRTNGKTTVALIWLMGLLSSITVVSNLGYQKYYRPDLLVPAMQQVSSVPVLIATTHNTLVQTGEMMGIGWEFKHNADASKSPINPQFLLAHQDQQQCQGTACLASKTLQKTLAQLPRPLDLWLVNFQAPVEEDLPSCFAEEATQYKTSVDGYATQLYRCLTMDSKASR